MTKALVVLSGGQDSTTALYWAKEKISSDLAAVTFDYGQRHSIEIEAAKTISKMAGVKDHEIIRLGSTILKSTSPLTDPAAQLETYNNFQEMDNIIGDRIEKTFVPMRNALFLTIAANRAAAMGVRYLVTGVCQQDNANYPDCREVFINSMEDTINKALGSGKYIHIATPLMFLTKAESIKMAMQLPGCMDALAYSHTAYDGQYPPTSKDHASTLRAQGFLEAGVPDPLVLRAISERLMPIPESANYDSIRTVLDIAKSRGFDLGQPT